MGIFHRQQRPTWAELTSRSYSAGSFSDRLSACSGPIPAAIATMASGNTIRIPNTAKAIPQVRKRFCHTSSICVRTDALTTALSKLSETSSTDRITTIHSNCSVPARLPVLDKPYKAPMTRQMTVKMNENL